MDAIPVVTVGVDGSSASLTALEWAIGYARPRHASVHVVTGLTTASLTPLYTSSPLPEMRGAARSDAERVAGRALARLRLIAPELTSTASAVDRPAVPALLAASHRSDLVVVGSRGLSDLGNVLLGSVSAAVSARAACPVAVVRGAVLPAPDAPVVVGVDDLGGEPATLTAAFEEAAIRHAPLSVVHTWTDAGPVATLSGMVSAWPTWNELRGDATDLVDTVLAEWTARYPTVRVRGYVVRDDPAHTLLELGRTAGLLVVGSHVEGGRTLTSVAHRVVRHAECPVLVVRHPGGGPDRTHRRERRTSSVR